MVFNFSKSKQGSGRIVFALTLEKKKLTERIVVGEIKEVRRRLEDNGGDVYFDKTRPLGSLLITFESDKEYLWNAAATQLAESYSKGIIITPNRWKATKQPVAFLQQKYESGEPVAMFAAIQTWIEYLNCYAENRAAQVFADRMALLYRAFVLYGQHKPWQEAENSELLDLSDAIHDNESLVELWYPVRKRPFECVVVHSSFQPVIFYYLHKIREWGYVFQQCKVCNGFFLARSKHYELCSDKCRKVQAVEAKSQFDKRTKNDKPEQLYNAAYYYWNNRIRKIKKAVGTNSSEIAETDKTTVTGASPTKTTHSERLAFVNTTFAAFRKEALRQKAEIKRGTLKLSDFSSWLIEQRKVIDGLVQDL